MLCFLWPLLPAASGPKETSALYYEIQDKSSISSYLQKRMCLYVSIWRDFCLCLWNMWRPLSPLSLSHDVTWSMPTWWCLFWWSVVRDFCFWRGGASFLTASCFSVFVSPYRRLLPSLYSGVRDVPWHACARYIRTVQQFVFVRCCCLLVCIRFFCC